MINYQLTFTYLKEMIETLGKGVKHSRLPRETPERRH